MGRILVVGETVDGELTKLSTEVGTLARRLGEAGGHTVEGVIVAAGAATAPAAAELARYTGGTVIACNTDVEGEPVALAMAADGIQFGRGADYVLLGATPDGRDTAGMLAALLPAAVLTNATAVTWSDDGPLVEMSVFGGKLITRSVFTTTPGIITVRPNAVTAEVAAQPGKVDTEPTGDGLSLPEVTVVERIAEAAVAASIDDAGVIVAGGRGVGGEDGFRIVEELAAALGGAVGATRAAVDAGWISYSQQIGQTGKIVKPQLYLALGISGAIQHKVGMQTAETIVAINRDPDAPIAEFADLIVVGDLFEVAPVLLAELRSRSG